MLTVTSSNQNFGMLDGSYASGLTQLTQTNADYDYNPSLSVIVPGGMLYGGGTAAGRRVMLPWGDETFDINSLNAAGLNLLRRSVDWAAGRDAADAEAKRHIWSLTTAPSGGNYYLSISGSMSGYASTLTATTGALQLNKWALVALIYNGSTAKLYKDGVEVASINAFGTFEIGPTVPCWIGSQPAATLGAASKPFNGIIDEVAIFAYALTPAQLGAINTAGSRHGARIVRWQEVQ